MEVNITAKDVLLDIVMLIAALLIVVQIDEYQHLLFLQFHGLLYAAILLCIVPAHHLMLVAHGLLQTILDYFD